MVDLLLQTAIDAARVAGEAVLPLFRQSALAVDYKADNSPVTLADKAAELVARAVIAKDFPDDTVFGEELGGELSDKSRQWVIDPIDGTKSFAVGNPLFGNMVGVIQDGKPLLSAIFIPALDELYYGDGKQSYYIKGQAEPMPITARDAVVPLKQAKLLSTSPDLFSTQTQPIFRKLAKECAFTAYGGDCYNYMLLALGLADFVMEDGLQPYDILPLVPILQGAGCMVTDWQGGEIMAKASLKSSQKILASADKTLHQQALKIINK